MCEACAMLDSFDAHDAAEHRRDLSLDEDLCPECRGPMVKSWLDGVLECPSCVQMKDSREMQIEARRLERATRPHKSRRRL